MLPCCDHFGTFPLSVVVNCGHECLQCASPQCPNRRKSVRHVGTQHTLTSTSLLCPWHCAPDRCGKYEQDHFVLTGCTTIWFPYCSVMNPFCLIEGTFRFSHFLSYGPVPLKPVLRSIIKKGPPEESKSSHSLPEGV